MDYKNTLNLPRTDFAMKADLLTREPQRLDKWEQENLYTRIQAARANAPKFVLHDGPPFTSGDAHIGTALNKILKDIIIKYKTLRGYQSPYVPGWGLSSFDSARLAAHVVTGETGWNLAGYASGSPSDMLVNSKLIVIWGWDP